MCTPNTDDTHLKATDTPPSRLPSVSGPRSQKVPEKPPNTKQTAAHTCRLAQTDRCQRVGRGVGGGGLELREASAARQGGGRAGQGRGGPGPFSPASPCLCTGATGARPGPRRPRPPGAHRAPGRQAGQGPLRHRVVAPSSPATPASSTAGDPSRSPSRQPTPAWPLRAVPALLAGCSRTRRRAVLGPAAPASQNVPPTPPERDGPQHTQGPAALAGGTVLVITAASVRCGRPPPVSRPRQAGTAACATGCGTRSLPTRPVREPPSGSPPSSGTTPGPRRGKGRTATTEQPRRPLHLGPGDPLRGPGGQPASRGAREPTADPQGRRRAPRRPGS